MSNSLAPPAWVAGLILLSILLYYGGAATRINSKITDFLIPYIGLSRDNSYIEVTAMLRLIVAGLLQLCFFIILIIFGNFGLGLFLPAKWQPILLLYGVLLGIGEMALCSFLCNICMRAATLLSASDYRLDKSAWFTLSKGGWMRSFLKTIKIAPIPVALLAILLYVGIEEAIFRGVIISALRSRGNYIAVVTSTILFTAVQTFNMPTWRNALFPVVGATVMGITHGVLYLMVPDVLPLIVAHLVLFIAAAL